MNAGVILEFLNMGGGEIILILGVVMLLFGGKKLPELARGLGKGIRDFKDASEGVKREIHRNINAMDIDEDLKAENDKYDQQHAATPTLEEQMYPTAAAAPINLTKNPAQEEVTVPVSESPAEVSSEAPVISTEASDVPVAKTSAAPLGTPIASYSAHTASTTNDAHETAAVPQVSKTETTETVPAPETVTPAATSPAPEKAAQTASVAESPKVAASAAAPATETTAVPVPETVTPETASTAPSETEKHKI